MRIASDPVHSTLMTAPTSICSSPLHVVAGFGDEEIALRAEHEKPAAAAVDRLHDAEHIEHDRES